jgi:uncharacterized protein (TIGR02246 family)
MKTLNILIILTLCAGIFSCKSESPADNKVNHKSSIESLNKDRMSAIEKGEMEKLETFYTEDIHFMASNAPAFFGRKNIKSYFSQLKSSGIKKMNLETTDVDVSGNLAVEIGRYKTYAAGEKLIDEGKYIVQWKNENGKWLIRRDIFNSDRPLPRTVAKKDERVRTVTYVVKKDKKQEFTNFVRNTVVPAIDQSKLKNIRFIEPVDPEKDGSFRFTFIIDPITEGFVFAVPAILKDKHGDEKSKKLISSFNSMVTKTESTTGKQTEF